MKIEFVSAGPAPGALLATPAFEGAGLADASLDAALAAKVASLMAAGRFRGRMGDVLSFPTTGDGVLVIGAGKPDAWNAGAAELFAAHAYNAAKPAGADTLVIALSGGSPEMAAQAGLGVRLASYRFDKYRTRQKPEDVHPVATVRIAADDPAGAAAAYERLTGLADAVCFARDLISEPANVLYPAEFARRVAELSRLGLEVEVLGEVELAALGMGALLGVGQGSRRESQLAILQWRGAADPTAAPVAFVGKGVCFDSGGISLKGADGMQEMIIDMSGAAAVAGAMYALAARSAPVNAVGILGLVENMPDGNAQRPGDIVTTASGQTVEIINTDAEGRLVLADALWYCQDRFRPRVMIDLATLTGAIMTALGGDIGGLFSNDDALAANLLAASAATDERLWRLPLPDDYAKALESRAADLKHTGDRFGGAITAALFLKRFVGGTPWAHLDVGMTVWKTKSTSPTSPDGATGYGVRLLDRLVADFYET
ncbi:MAG TPA: leucyl aminopeptidase [Caulobacteraceae bacterium]|jgi:leucyl aminopeptidase|nr:leucyl aminopeptidase [Caulobacteraceae bacterium]